ncbi:lysine exporter LysO family protein [Oceanirhabdus sp. W0125-5]|uniref:lysine exporter LysO family protein n=1 Tax=Oceanirhabdus sp. W0125-5 TaxID=2999116 RepID=UPI0022F2E31D|nr:lysine exporter LysO family protein [Oceanirhabdus sp. W0125-5]WBW97741.1 lysine exporter LysO family protein [Oceanirhabdus sp. W0125-5]
MTLSIILSVIFGIIAGYFFFPESVVPYMDTVTTIALNLLIFFVGIDLGLNKHIFKDLKKHGVLLILIPLSIILGSLAGGLITGLIFDMPSNISLSISSGFGWYSLSGVILTKLHSAEIGTIAFLTNVFRELITVMTIPFIAKYLNDYSTIAPAGATSMDTTLPIISRYTKPEIVVIAFFNGAVLSTLVPILVPFFYSI